MVDGLPYRPNCGRRRWPNNLRSNEGELGSNKGNWKPFKGNVKVRWGKLTYDQLDVIAGKRDNLVGKIRGTHGISEDETEKQLSDWQNRMKK